MERGVEVVLTTGRSPASVKNLAEETGADHYIICGNGAIVYDLQKQETIYQNLLDKKKVLQLIEICEENSIYNNIIFSSIIKKIKMVKNVDVLDVGHMSKKIIKDGTEEYPLEYYYTEVSSQNVDKWSAILKLIEKLNIQPEEVIAIGDNVNDQTMLENAGLGIAMGNSAPYIQEMADEVTLDNNSNGVAVSIEKHILTV